MRGFSLLELLIALMLFSTALVFALQQHLKCRYSLRGSYYKQVALEQSLSLTARLHVNSDPIFQLREIEEWNQENNVLLPRGVGTYLGSKTKYQIIICWMMRQKECLYFPS